VTETIHQLEVLRYDPETDTAPHFQTYEVSCQEDWVVLDAINYVKENLDRTLSYRWSCHMAVCGSCGMVVNGEPVLSCHAFVRDYPEKIRVEPLRYASNRSATFRSSATWSWRSTTSSRS
jgi:fumarate reductase iron-sulfur subunit